MPIKQISDDLFESSELLTAFTFIKQHSLKNTDQVYDLVKVDELFFIQRHISENNNSKERLISSYKNGIQVSISFTEILSGLNSEILKIDNCLRNYVVQVVEREN